MVTFSELIQFTMMLIAFTSLMYQIFGNRK